MYSKLSVFGFLLLILPTSSTYCEQVIHRSMLKLFPKLNISNVPCEPTKWLDTYKNASYVGMIKISPQYNLLPDGYWLNRYEEKIRFKGSKPQYLFTNYRSLIQDEHYIITSNADGEVSNCMGFAENDGEVATRVLRLENSHRDLLDKLFDWAKLYKTSDLVEPKC